MFLEHQIGILAWFLKDRVTLMWPLIDLFLVNNLQNVLVATPYNFELNHFFIYIFFNDNDTSDHCNKQWGQC